MYLTKIELCGFKSFPDRTVFEFDTGITAILGPNGCGKSNVVDAVKWVLGESRAKSLRGDRMLDVIFAGSERRRPTGMAEVSLYFDNSDQTLATEYNEVCVTRRLYRSGESEYLINHQPCRRRDIRELFMDTGVGTSAYSFIEQGKVEALLNAKPDERRAVFEEAAGISKYKARRKETMARLERTNQYLDRVNDVVEEIERSVRRAARQAANARRHQRLKAQVDALRLHLYLRRQRAFSDRLEQLAGKQRELQELFASESARRARLDRETCARQEEEDRLSREATSKQQVLLELQERLGQVQARKSATTERLAGLARETTEGERRIAENRSRLRELENTREEAVTTLAAARDRLREVEARLAELERERHERQQARDDLNTELAAARALLRRHSENEQEALRRATHLQSEAAARREQVQRLQKRGQILTEEREQAMAARKAAEQELRELTRQITQFRDRETAAREREADLEAEVQEYSTRLQELSRTKAAKSSRLSTLQELERDFAGAGQGVKTLLAAARAGLDFAAGVKGMLVDLLSIPRPVATAIEAVLGDHAQDLVVENRGVALRCIDHLAQAGAGRARFLPLDTVGECARLPRSLASLPGVLGDAADLVQSAPEHARVVASRLAGCLVVGTRDDALRLQAGAARGVRLATLQGEIFEADGALAGGAGAAGGLVSRKAEKQALGAELQELSFKVRRVEAGLEQARSALAAARAELQAARGGISELQPRLQDATRRSHVAGSTLARVEEEQGRLGAERDEALTALERGGRELARCEHELASHREQRGRAETEAAAREEQLERLQAQFAALTENLGGAREERARLQANIGERERALAAIDQGLRDNAKEVEKLLTAGARAQAEQVGLRERMEELHGRERELLQERDEAQQEGVKLRERLEQVRRELEEWRGEERALRQRLERVTEARTQLELQEGEARMRLAHLAEQAREQLGITDLARHLEERAQAGSPDAMENGAQSPNEETTEMEEDPTPLSDEELSERIQELTGRIERIGPVNLQAIEEQAELEARAEFLRADQEDLFAAARDLLAVIERLNRECAQRFDATFQQVRRNFQEMFRMLFGGGKGDIVLQETEGLEGADKLDAGIEIIARPPGKEPKSISLLSGGEKALCAVALLFAIFRSKPSPFCILDEVDGPLDESNIDRFMKAVQDFARDTQFILISHAKRTMSMTEVIYGVTQEEPGVSTKYSLSFRQEYGQEEPAQTREEEQVVA